MRDERNRELFDLPDAPRPDEDTPAPVRFLPEFDNALLSHDDRTRIMADEHRPRVFLKNLQVLGTVLVDGFVAGTWRLERKKKSAALAVSLFTAVSKRAGAEIESEGEKLVPFLEPDASESSVKEESHDALTFAFDLQRAVALRGQLLPFPSLPAETPN